DVEYAAGWDTVKRALERNCVAQRNNLSGLLRGNLAPHDHPFGRCPWAVTIKDISGWSGKEGLARFAAALGEPMGEKGTMDRYKSRMAWGLLEHPEEFLRYAVDDARVLPRLVGRFVRFLRAVQVKLGMPEADLWTAETIPMTAGRLVAETF